MCVCSYARTWKLLSPANDTNNSDKTLTSCCRSRKRRRVVRCADDRAVCECCTHAARVCTTPNNQSAQWYSLTHIAELHQQPTNVYQQQQLLHHLLSLYDQLWAASLISRKAVTWHSSLSNAERIGGRPCDIANIAWSCDHASLQVILTAVCCNSTYNQKCHCVKVTECERQIMCK